MMKNLLGMSEPDLFFDVMVHFGTLIPIVWIFREDLLKIFRSLFTLINHVSSRNQFQELLTSDKQVRLIGLIGIAVIPTALIGYSFKDLFEHLFSSLFAVGVSLTLTGTLLLLTRIITHRQKVMLARGLTRETDVFLFDEPTVGIDVGAKVEVYELMKALVEAGAAIILVSSELPEVLHLSNRLYVMHRARLVAELSGEDINEQAVLSCFFQEEGKETQIEAARA